MRRFVKVLAFGLLASAGVVANACGGNAEDAPPPAMPTAQSSAPAMSSTPTASVAPSASVAPTASVVAPPMAPLPPELAPAVAAVKAATDKLTPTLTKNASCDVLAGDLSKFAKDNAAVFLTLNKIVSKLSEAQQQAAQQQAAQGNGMSPDDQAKMMQQIQSSALGKCLEKKDKKVVGALGEFVTVMTAGMTSQPTLGGLAGPALPPPQTSASAAPKPASK